MNNIPSGLLNPDYTTTWNPGILADQNPADDLGEDGLPVRNELCQTVPPNQAASLQSVLDDCSANSPGKVVQLAAGTYPVSSTITVPSNVVLRGNASAGANATIVTLASGQKGPVLSIGVKGRWSHEFCYGWSGIFNGGASNAPASLAADARNGEKTVTITSGSGLNFEAGDMALIDQKNDSQIDTGDMGGAFQRTDNYKLGERVEIASVEGTKLTLKTPLHWTFRTALEAKISLVSRSTVTRWAGIEHLWIKNGNGTADDGSWWGEKSGGIDIANAAYCWVKDVQTDGTLTGMHIALTGTYRCVVRDSHFHNSKLYGFGTDNYGIVLRCAAADNLIENNVARYMNKPILFNNSGGGNVVGYNYADNSWSLDNEAKGNFQESGIDCHAAYPHMELIEGNYAPHMGASTTHGNASYLTFFRNYASSQQAPNPIVWSTPTDVQYSNVKAIQFDAPDDNMTVIGNVLGSTTDAALGVPTSLGTAEVTTGYMVYDGSPAVFGLSKQGSTEVNLWLYGNYDTYNKQVMDHGQVASGTSLPASLYLKKKPAWWPADRLWPWVGSDLTPMVGALPAQVYSSDFNYNTSDNPSCTPDGGAYRCQCQ